MQDEDENAGLMPYLACKEKFDSIQPIVRLCEPNESLQVDDEINMGKP